VLTGVALSLLGAVALLVGCSKEESDDPAIVINNGGSTSNAGSSGGGQANNGGGGSGGDTAGGGTGGAGGACAVAGQVRNPMSGECSCPPYRPMECPTVGCVNTMEDVENCGMCGTACDTNAACAAGACTTPPVAIATLTGCMRPRMVLAGGTLYIADAGTGTVSSVATTAGSTPVELTTGQTSPWGIAVDDTNVYFATGYTPPESVISVDDVVPAGSIFSVPLAGGTPTELIALDEAARAIGVQDDMLYFTHMNDLFKIPTTGVAEGGAGMPPGPITCLPDTPPADAANPPMPGPEVPGATYVGGSNESCTKNGLPAAIALSATHIFYGIGVRAAVEANSVNGGMYLEMGESQGELKFESLFVTDTHGYWATGDHVQRAPLTTGKLDQEQVVATLEFDPVNAFTITATHAYVASEGGVIQKAAFADIGPDQKAVPLATGQDGARGLANDGTNLYWINGDCSIMSTPL
jgi:hypothetical protein